MWPVERPELDAGETFAICISQVKNPAMRQRLTAIRPEIEAAAADYAENAEHGELHLFPQAELIGTVPGSEMVRTYDVRMVKKGQPGRHIYDQIKLLPKGDRCPFCDHRNISTLDHILPKARYPVLAVTPDNLVGACADCNKMKLDAASNNPGDMVLHPYFDVVYDQRWLTADVVQQTPAALTFHVIDVDEWDDVLNARVAHQFGLLGLANLYSSEAAQEIANIRFNLQRHFKRGGAAAVRAELEYQWESRLANRINSWQTATYEALAKSDWFCDRGFAEV